MRDRWDLRVVRADGPISASKIGRVPDREGIVCLCCVVAWLERESWTHQQAVLARLPNSSTETTGPIRNIGAITRDGQRRYICRVCTISRWTLRLQRLGIVPFRAAPMMADSAEKSTEYEETPSSTQPSISIAPYL